MSVTADNVISRATAPGPDHRPRDSARTLAKLIIVAAFTIVLAGVASPLFDLDRHAVPKELVLHLAALGALFLMLPEWRRIEAGVVEVLLAGFVAWTGLATLFATNRWLGLRGFAITFSGFVLYLAARRVAREHHGRTVLAALIAAVTLAAALGLAQAYGISWQWLEGNRPPGGTLGNRNFLGHLLAITAPCALLLGVRTPKTGRALIGFIALALIAAAIVLTRSRAAWLGVAVAFTVMFGAAHTARGVLQPVLSRARVLAAAFAMAAGVAAAVILPNRLEWRSDTPYVETLGDLANYREGSGRGRLIQYRNSLALVPVHPLVGVGPGNWFVHYPRVTRPPDPSFAGNDPLPTNPWPSSDWVAFFTERGVVGALLLLLAGGAIALTAARRVLGDNAEAAFAGVALLGTVSATAITGTFDAVLLLATPTFFVWSMLGLLMPDTRPIVKRPVTRRLHRATVQVAIVLAVAATLASAGTLTAILISGDGAPDRPIAMALRLDPGNHRLHLLLARRGRCNARLPFARALANLLPYHTAPRRALAACGEKPRPR